jgi:GTP cyclohydrolase II
MAIFGWSAAGASFRATRFMATDQQLQSMDAGPPSGLLELVTCQLPTVWGAFTMHALAVSPDGREHVALSIGRIDDMGPVLTRIHSEGLSGDTLFSLRCDCGPQLQGALRMIAAAGRGVLLYMRQEGRGIGLVNKIRAYALQQSDVDTVDANRQLGLPDDARDYTLAAGLLTCLAVQRIRLITNNPDKVAALTRLGIPVTERVPLRIASKRHNREYLQTKRRRMGHLIGGDRVDEQA